MNLWGRLFYSSMPITGMFSQCVFMKGLKKSVTASRGRFLNRGQGKVGCKALKSLHFCSETVIQSLKLSNGHLES